MVDAIAAAYGVTAVQGVLSHQVKKHVIDGNRVIANKTTIEHKVDEVTLEANDVFAFDVVMSTGEGRPNEQSARTTVFKRAVDQTYNLKMKTSRTFFSEVTPEWARERQQTAWLPSGPHS
jgi:methionine aminopeptidase